MGDKSPTKTPSKSKIDPKIVAAIIGGFFVIAAACIGAVATIGDDIIAILFNGGEISPTPIAQITDTGIQGITTENPSETPTIVSPTITPDSPSPSHTITITATPSITPSPTYINPDFKDDFDNGPSSMWENLTGTWRVIDGMYTADRLNRPVYSMVGDSNWKDYAVDVDISSQCQAGFPIYLLINSSDPGNGMQMEVNCCAIKWILYEQGEPTTIAKKDGSISFSGGCGFRNWIDNHVRIETKNGFYKMFLDGVMQLEVQDNTYSSGKAGIGFGCPPAEGTCPRFDNFVVEYIE